MIKRKKLILVYQKEKQMIELKSAQPYQEHQKRKKLYKTIDFKGVKKIAPCNNCNYSHIRESIKIEHKGAT